MMKAYWRRPGSAVDETAIDSFDEMVVSFWIVLKISSESGGEAVPAFRAVLENVGRGGGRPGEPDLQR